MTTTQALPVPVAEDTISSRVSDNFSISISIDRHTNFVCIAASCLACIFWCVMLAQ